MNEDVKGRDYHFIGLLGEEGVGGFILVINRIARSHFSGMWSDSFTCVKEK